MTDKERMAIIKHRLKRVKNNLGELNINDFLIFNVISQDIDFILKQNKRYGKTLEFYADRENYELKGHDTITKSEQDKGMRSRRALNE